MSHLVKNFAHLKDYIRVRFAPSPTGEMHLGNMRTAIVNYLFAKSQGGKFLLRIEDTDIQRSKKEYENSLLEKLSLMGINYDEEIVFQSNNINYHQDVAHQLLKNNNAYFCQCPSKGDDFQQQIICQCENNHYNNGALRFKVPKISLEFTDFIMGNCKAHGNDVHDFIILRQDGTPTYNLSVVCDDHTMDITHIIRGNDHLSNTFKQVAIYKAMDWVIPITAHLPLIVNDEGKKLSKRDGDISIKHYLEEGFLPDSLRSFLIRLGWSYKDQEIFSLDELLKIFPEGKFQKSSACYNESKLLHQNKYFIGLTHWDLNKNFIYNYWNIKIIANEKMAIEGFELIKTRCNTLKQLAESMKTYIPELFNEEYNEDFIKNINENLIEVLLSYFQNNTWNNLNYLENYNHLNEFMKTYNYETKDYQKILRYILTKESVGPHIAEIIKIIEFSQVVIRLLRIKNLM